MEGQRRPVQSDMSKNATNDTEQQAVDQDEQNRYAQLNIGDEEYVIYDRENHQAWIQSTVAISPTEMR